MPFVSSVRGSYGSQGKRRTQTGRISTGTTGGTITTAGGYRIHIFTGAGTSTFTPDAPASALEVLLVGGGGGGGSQVGGGGGAGGVMYSTTQVVLAQPYSVTVGAGGRGAYPFSNGAVRVGSLGASTTAFGITANGGGGGGGHGSGIELDDPRSGQPTENGRNGGSGGGAGANGSGANYGSATQASSGIYTGYGNRGGTATAGGWSGGGGGGAGSVGGNSPGGTTGGDGGTGLSFSISGSSQFYAAGGGGCWQGTAGSTTRASGIGGIGVGDSSTYAADSVAKAGVVNTGSGGGGSRDNSTGSGDGANGIIIIRYIP